MPAVEESCLRALVSGCVGHMCRVRRTFGAPSSRPRQPTPPTRSAGPRHPAQSRQHSAWARPSWSQAGPPAGAGVAAGAAPWRALESKRPLLRVRPTRRRASDEARLAGCASLGGLGNSAEVATGDKGRQRATKDSGGQLGDIVRLVTSCVGVVRATETDACRCAIRSVGWKDSGASAGLAEPRSASDDASSRHMHIVAIFVQHGAPRAPASTP